ncbi:DUF2141 domain-containing protein [Cupriavidus basilensis]|uniref:DUF2141 domain-containing protein n=1 Tax=Cupriavidus basilensis TaxID=68895 RepID=A0ABT6B2R9_9BURK|nr:DUF2141 domain-containing protein [Cupriavidus basilensis]MDF3839165.1 DUF2141 domain-containing protein [Cupriavidus basilensis]
MQLTAFLSRPVVHALCTTAILAPAGALAADLSVSVTDGPTAEATLYVALYSDAASYADSKAMASQKAPMHDGQGHLVFAGLAPGRYALRAFADENGNGKLDTNLMRMPIERYGFSNDARGNRAAPDFEAAAIRVDGDQQTVIHLR